MNNNDDKKVMELLAKICICAIVVLVFFVITVYDMKVMTSEDSAKTETEIVDTEKELKDIESDTEETSTELNRVFSDLDIDVNYNNITISDSGNTYLYKTNSDAKYIDVLDKLLYNGNYAILSIDTSSNYCITFIYIGETEETEIETEENEVETETEMRDSNYET
jgi:hypothetical protein